MKEGYKMNWYTILKLEGLLNDVIEMEIENYGEMIVNLDIL